MKKQVLEAVAEDDYRGSAKRIETSGNTISHEQVGRILEKEGAEIKKELFGPEAQVNARTEAPKNAPALMIIQADGSRYRTNEDDRKKAKGGDTSRAEAADDPHEPDVMRAAAAFGEIPARERKSGWRENKVGIVIRAEPGSVEPDGTWNPPKEIVKTYVATTEGIERFGYELRTEAERRGIEKAKQVVFLSDNGHGIPRMAEREFKEAVRITDFKHASDRLKDSARVIHGEEESKAALREKTRHEFKGLLWDGKVEEVIGRLADQAERLAPRPKKLSALSSKPDAKTLWSHVFYFEKWKHTMDYPAYRAKGWPISSASVESACGQFGDRVKHARMRWTRAGADAVHVVKAAIFSQDGRWERRWPAPIPVLELPMLEYLAPAA